MQSSDATSIETPAAPPAEASPSGLNRTTETPALPPSKSKFPAFVIPLAIAAVVVLIVGLAINKIFHRELSVESEPAGASVFVNGRLAGKTPLRISGLPAGEFSLRFEKDGCEPLSVPVVLSWGSTRISEALPPRGVGAMHVAVEPIGSEVLLDGELVGYTPLDLNNVTTGSHELLVRKTNFKTFTQRIVVESGFTQEFKDFALEDVVLKMLSEAIEKDPQRVGNYTDMGHYLFTNNKLKESAEFYVRGVQVSSTPLTFAKDVPPEERRVEMDLRAHDIERINDEIRKKMNHIGRNAAAKDMQAFVAAIERAQEDASVNNTADWRFVYEQAKNFIEDKKYDKADALYQRHIDTAKGMETVAQAHIGIITLRIHYTKDIAQALLACKQFEATPYVNNPAIARQAANAIYGNAAVFSEKDRKALYEQAEALLRRALANAPRRSEMSALCKFELANVLSLLGRYEEAEPMYRDSVIETGESTTKELRSQKQVETLRKLNHIPEAMEVLKLLAKSPRSDIAAKAKNDLKELEGAQSGTR